MSKFRELSYLQHGDYFSYENKIYRVDWDLNEPNNAIRVKDNSIHAIEEFERVKWLENYEKFSII